MNHATSRRNNRDISTSLDNIPDTCPICHHSIEPLQYANAELADVDFSNRIKRVSGKFCGIYNEAQKAEQLGLSQLCEAGYRKSLEFVIRDYVSMLHKGREQDLDNIAKIPLGACIEGYVTDRKIRAIAKRAAWLENDETRYVMEWKGKDLQDIKMLIDLTVHWIEIELFTRDLLKSMPEK